MLQYAQVKDNYQQQLNNALENEELMQLQL